MLTFKVKSTLCDYQRALELAANLLNVANADILYLYQKDISKNRGELTMIHCLVVFVAYL